MIGIELVRATAAALSLWSGAPATTMVDGPRPQDEVRAAIEAARPALSSCVDARAPTLESWVSLSFTIYKEGLVDLVHVEERGAPPSAFDEACVAATLRRLRLTPRDDRKKTVAHILLTATIDDAAPLGPKLLRAEIAAVVDEAQAELAACYRAARAADPDLEGTVLATLTIDTTGGVTGVDVRRGSLRSKDARGCVGGVLSSLRFPRPRGGADVVVEYPLVFAREPEGGRGAPAADASSGKPWESARNLFECFGCGESFSTKNLVPR